MGFKYKKRNGPAVFTNDQLLSSGATIFFREIKKMREQGRLIIYLDETWVNHRHSKAKAWEDTAEERAMSEPPSGKGKILIFLHAGFSQGLLPDECKMLFLGKKDSADCNSEMNACHFEEWPDFNFLTNLPAGTVIVMDNASYHSRTTEETQSPTASSRKADIQAWLLRTIPAHFWAGA